MRRAVASSTARRELRFGARVVTRGCPQQQQDEAKCVRHTVERDAEPTPEGLCEVIDSTTTP